MMWVMTHNELGKGNIGTQWDKGYFSLPGVWGYMKGGMKNKLEKKVDLGARIQRSLGAG